ncbi:MAG: hypothetical protein RMA76_03410 [Deltaproteobacteria bacterium]
MCYTTSLTAGTWNWMPQHPSVSDNAISAGEILSAASTAYISTTTSPSITVGQNYYVALCAQWSGQPGAVGAGQADMAQASNSHTLIQVLE